MADAKKPDRPGYATDFIKGDWDKAQYLDNPHVDNLMSCVLALGAEFWTLKRRQLVTEKLIEEKKGNVDRAMIEAYVPTEAERTAWAAERDDYIERVFAVLTRVSEHVGGKSPTTKVPAIKVE